MQLFKRIIENGFKGFYRNKTISASSVFILVVTMFIIANLFIFKAVFDNTIATIKSKVDISIYIKNDTSDASILNLKQRLESLPEIKSVEYVSKEETLEKFKEDYKDDPITMSALNEIGSNPFGASFSVQAVDTKDYDAIMSKINQQNLFGDDSSKIEKINYVDIKDSIAKLNNIIDWVTKIGTFIVFIFVAMSCMIVYNTVRLAIFTFREEISIMKLVGASNFYIRGPFIVEGILYGVVASIITMLLLFPSLKWVGTKTVTFLAGFNIHEYYKDNFVQLFLIILLSGIFVATFSSSLAVRKYLKV